MPVGAERGETEGGVHAVRLALQVRAPGTGPEQAAEKCFAAAVIEREPRDGALGCASGGAEIERRLEIR
jgi:hypothetical protein